jgi:hypothetical protein
MPYKIRKATTKKNAEKKKTRYSVHTRTSRLLSRVRRLISPPSRQPFAITIGTDGLTEEQIDLLKELEATGRIPKITWIASSPNGFDDVMKFALLYLHSNEAKEMGCKILHGYDYAWIKTALERGPIPDRYSSHRYMSTPKFVDYIKSLGFKDIAGSKTLNKAIAQAKWHSEGNMLTFHRCFISVLERKRRNNIILKFLEIMNEI